MGDRIRIGHHVSLTLPADVEELIQRERQKQKHATGYKPPRGIIIAEAIRAHYGHGRNVPIVNGDSKRKRA